MLHRQACALNSATPMYMYNDLPQKKWDVAECLELVLSQCTASGRWTYCSQTLDYVLVQVYEDENSSPNKWPDWAKLDSSVHATVLTDRSLAAVKTQGIFYYNMICNVIIVSISKI